MNLSDISIRRPVFAAMLIMGLVVLGLVSLSRLEMQMDPDVEFPLVFLVTELRGASPETVEREVTDVLEEQINAIEGVRTLQLHLFGGPLANRGRVPSSTTTSTSRSQEVRDKVALARPCSRRTSRTRSSRSST